MKGLYIELLTHGRGAGFFVWGPHRKERAFIIDPSPLSLIFKKTVPMRNPGFYVGTLSVTSLARPGVMISGSVCGGSYVENEFPQSGFEFVIVTSQVQTFLISLGMAENAA